MTPPQAIPVRRRGLQFSLRTLFVLTLFAGAGLGRLAIEIKRVQQQKQDVAAMKQIPGTQVIVTFRHELDAKGRPLSKAKRPPPGWMARLLGEDFGASVASVSISGPGAMQALDYVLKMRDLEHLSVSVADPLSPNGPDDPWTVEDLKSLGGLTKLRTLELGDVTLAHPGVKYFKRLADLETLQLGRARMYRTSIKNWQRELPD